MTLKMSIQLYVENVALERRFFSEIGFTEIAFQEVEGSETVTFAPDNKGNALLQIWDIQFIRAVSPEVAENKPSLLFTVDDIGEWHDRVEALGGFTSELETLGDKQTFNFQTPNGCFFAFMEN
ncbi:VOC family protein [Lactococcus taiwanensis]|uniref:VOC family protein n=1 Tax=Lactococcus taiwanensis TaxID=1151742 RepID=UPI003D0DDDDE